LVPAPPAEVVEPASGLEGCFCVDAAESTVVDDLKWKLFKIAQSCRQIVNHNHGIVGTITTVAKTTRA
jgi:hypothetical protein